MIRGRSIAAGTMTVDGEELTGIFVECTIDELRNQKFSIFNEVALLTASEFLERAATSGVGPVGPLCTPTRAHEIAELHERYCNERPNISDSDYWAIGNFVGYVQQQPPRDSETIGGRGH